MKRFCIRLKEVHDNSGKTPYRVAMDTGLSQTTVRKYVTENEVITEHLPSTVVVLLDYYQVNWRDPKVIEMIEVSEDDEETETKRPEILASTA